MTDANSSTAVRVAVRIRPLLANERVQECGECLRRESSTQIVLGEQRMFTYDFCFGKSSAQAEMYEQCVEPLLQSFVQGFNSTVMAYGQTGSGKSHTMGTENTGLSRPEEEKGLVPRVIQALFRHIKEKSNSSSDYTVRCTFLEIYNEELRDLLDPSNRSKSITIRETANGQVVPFGIEEREISSTEELLNCLEDGSINRSTGSTLMNANSSRSHAIFSVHLTQRRLIPASEAEGDDQEAERAEFISSKFTFVDLAGSERLKKTGAEGSRRREGININCGLLALGNVISALGDPNRKATHVPFRDSKITRLLQDSLGGNSKTLMVACVSPADVHFEETLNTLRYASRARNIVNKPIIGRDPNSQKLEIYRQRINRLEAALAKLGVDPSRITSSEDFVLVRESATSHNEPINDEIRNEMMDLRKENSFLDAEVLRLMALVKNDRRAFKQLNEKCCNALAQRDAAQAALRSLIEQARSVGPLDAQTILKETEEFIREDPESSSTQEDVVDDAQDPLEDIGEHELELSVEGDSDIEDEVDDLEGLRKRRDRQFRHQNEQNARALRRLDADMEHKNALIEQLIRSKQQAEATKQLYEQRITEMENSVKTTQDERNTVLSKIVESRDSVQKIEAVKAEYHEKLLSMTAQLEELKRKYKENERVLRTRPKSENRIAVLQEDINKIKRQRVSLQRQMKEEADKHRAWVQEHQHQVAQLQKQLRKDSVQICRMNNKIHQQDLVMKAKTERATLLQRELTETKRRMACSKPKPKTRQHQPVSTNMKDAIKKVIESAVQSRELFVQKANLMHQQYQLESKLDELTQEVVSSPQSPIEFNESIDTVKTELEFIKSKISETHAQQSKMNRRGNSKTTPLGIGYIGHDLFPRIGIDEDNAPTLQSLLIYLVNHAVRQRQSRDQSKRREKELEAEILQLQAESETTAARLDLAQRESDRRVILAEKERERERQALLDLEFDDGSIRKLESQLTRVKRQQSQLLSPIAEHGPRRSRRRLEALPSAQVTDENVQPPQSARRVRHSYRKAAQNAIDRRAAPSEPSLADSALPSRSTRSTPVPTEESERSVLDRLTDKSRFTGTSRYASKALLKGADTEFAVDGVFKPKQQLPRSPNQAEYRDFDLSTSAMSLKLSFEKEKPKSDQKLL